MLYHKAYRQPNSSEWIVLIHGAGGSSSTWFKQLRDYIQHFNVLLLDLRGHGKSEHLAVTGAKGYSFNEVSMDVIEVLDYLNIRSAHFVGISLGTVIIRTIGEIDHSRVKSMILGGAVTRLNLRSRFLVMATKLLKHYIPFIWLYSICAYILMPRHKESRSIFIREAKRLAQAEFLRWFKLSTEVTPLLKYFHEKEIPVPTLYLMGDQDYMFLPAARKISNEHSHAHLHIIQESGHVCNVDQPEAFNKVSIDFVYKVAEQSSSVDFMAQLKSKQVYLG